LSRRFSSRPIDPERTVNAALKSLIEAAVSRLRDVALGIFIHPNRLAGGIPLANLSGRRTGVMEMNRSGVPLARSNIRQRERRLAERRGAARKPVENDGVATLSPVAGRDPAAPTSVLKFIRARPLGRTLALWIIAGALWISLGMIVSATLVTVAYLT
jgi:hypothetical protein